MGSFLTEDNTTNLQPTQVIYKSESSGLYGQFYAFDEDSGIASAEYVIGTYPGSDDVMKITSTNIDASGEGSFSLSASQKLNDNGKLDYFF